MGVMKTRRVSKCVITSYSIHYTKLYDHGGTLDPKVTGALPVALGNATKCVSIWHLPPKEYVCLMQLHEDAKIEDVKKIFNEFTGRIHQRPPRNNFV